MYCRKCYADLRSTSSGRCPNCRLGFDPDNPATFLSRPVPTKKRMILHVILTTIVGIAAAFVVALHQAVRSSGH